MCISFYSMSDNPHRSLFQRYKSTIGESNTLEVKIDNVSVHRVEKYSNTQYFLQQIVKSVMYVQRESTIIIALESEWKWRSWEYDIITITMVHPHWAKGNILNAVRLNTWPWYWQITLTAHPFPSSALPERTDEHPSISVSPPANPAGCVGSSRRRSCQQLAPPTLGWVQSHRWYHRSSCRNARNSSSYLGEKYQDGSNENSNVNMHRQDNEK